MIPAIFLTCALALPSTMEWQTPSGRIRHMEEPFFGRIQMVQMLHAFTSEYIDDNRRRVLVVGEMWKMVVAMRHQNIKAFGLWHRKTRNRYVARGLEYLMPFGNETFAILINDSRMERIMDLLVLRLSEFARVIVPGGFLFTPSDPGDMPERFLTGLGFRRLAFTFERLAVFQKKGNPKSYWAEDLPKFIPTVTPKAQQANGIDDAKQLIGEYKWLHDLLESMFPGNEFIIMPDRLHIQIPEGWTYVILHWRNHIIYRRPKPDMAGLREIRTAA